MITSCFRPGWAVGLLLVAVAVRGPLAAKPVDVREFGARGDGATDDTAAIRRAISAAVADGGGTVFFPAGNYLSFSLQVRSRLTLHLGPGATLIAAEPSPDLSVGYDAPEPNDGVNQYQDFGHSHWSNSLIWGEGVTDVSIIGPGTIYGRGLSRGDRGRRRDFLPEERSREKRPDLALPAAALARLAEIKPGPFGHPGKDSLPAGVGNKAIALKNCRNVTFRDFTIYHGGHFAILATGVDNWTIDNLRIDTNRDGVDIDACQNVRMSNCTVNAPYDDAICLKSSYGLGYARMTENVTITNCHVSGYDEGSLLDGTRSRRVRGYTEDRPTGRIKLGTESNGGFRNITISNCVFDYSRGLALESVDGALLEDIAITNLTLRDVLNAPIYVRLGARLRAPEGTNVGKARRIRISNIIAHNVSAEGGILIAGLPGHPIEDLWLENIYLGYLGGGTKEQGERAMPEDERGYPEPTYWGVMPASGLWVRHAANLNVHRIEMRFEKPDLRPVMMLEDVKGAEFSSVRLSGAERNPWVVKPDVTGLVVDRSPELRSVP
ncbi:MAG: right-handed parallel beta-helix repeat-containing protein [Opitutaceae bacterium]|nr:right-handed parallel beta-helix repeat-containing protein [Opitutaceae bacterium]